MRKIITFFIILVIFLFPLTVMAGEGPLELPSGANEEAKKQNQEGIIYFNKGNFEEALKHFRMASKVDSNIGESHFNEALALHNMDEHGKATMHFKAAKKHANGNSEILNSPVLKDHIGG